jgi:hypothetical protein
LSRRCPLFTEAKDRENTEKGVNGASDHRNEENPLENRLRDHSPIISETTGMLQMEEVFLVILRGMPSLELSLGPVRAVVSGEPAVTRIVNVIPANPPQAKGIQA